MMFVTPALLKDQIFQPVDRFMYSLPKNCLICLTTAFCGSEIWGHFIANEFEKWDTNTTACV